MVITELFRPLQDTKAGGWELRRNVNLYSKIGEIAQLQPNSGGEINYSSATLADSLWRHGPDRPLIGLALGLGQDDSLLGPIKVSLVPTNERGKQRLLLRRGDYFVRYSFDRRFNVSDIEISDMHGTYGRIDVNPETDSLMAENIIRILHNDLLIARNKWSEDLSAKARQYVGELDRTVDPMASWAVGSMIQVVRQRFPVEWDPSLQIYALPTVKEGEQGKPAVRLLLTQARMSENVMEDLVKALETSEIGEALEAAGEDLLIQADYQQGGLGMPIDSGSRELTLRVRGWNDPAKSFTVEMRNPVLDTDFWGRAGKISAMIEDDFANFLSGRARPGFSLRTIHPGFESIPEKAVYVAENLVLLWSRGKEPQPIKETAEAGLKG